MQEDRPLNEGFRNAKLKSEGDIARAVWQSNMNSNRSFKVTNQLTGGIIFHWRLKSYSKYERVIFI